MFDIEVDIAQQLLRLRQNNEIVETFRVSTAKNGAGEINGSEQTPRGRHIIRAKIGHGEAENTVFVARRTTGERYQPELREQFPQRDWILTRIMWLSGLEVGKNRLGPVDTMRRYIYIHGCPDEDTLGIPSSHGCIKMRNTDVIHLFEQAPLGTPVWIHE